MPAVLTSGVRAGVDLSRVGAGLGRGPRRSGNMAPAQWAGTWPAPGATIDLDFANNRSYVRGRGQGGVMAPMTFVRGSGGTYIGSDGLLKTAGSGVPRFDWGSRATVASGNTPVATLTKCLGLLVEESRTNLVLWCRDTTQAAWAKTTVSSALDQTGIDGVAGSCSSVLATADGGTCLQSITMASSVVQGSLYLRRLTGSGAVQITVDGTTWSTVALSVSEWRRLAIQATVTNPVVGIKLATAGDSVALDYGQLEKVLGSSKLGASSPILTTGASATRAQDDFYWPAISDTWWGSREFTLALSTKTGFTRGEIGDYGPELIGPSRPPVLGFGTGQWGSDRYDNFTNNNGLIAARLITPNGVPFCSAIASSYWGASRAEGGASVDSFQSQYPEKFPLPAITKTFKWAGYGGIGRHSGVVESMKYWPYRLSDDALKAVTS